MMRSALAFTGLASACSASAGRVATASLVNRGFDGLQETFQPSLLPRRETGNIQSSCL
ncbi:hypothetical protein CPB85DRAFT_1277665 [Mucidula mucida]|nr:hypothetical protein CPB85DRAFT_1277665 [Mucidula mucida]